MSGRFESSFEGTKHAQLGGPSDGARAAYERMGYTNTDFYEHFPCFVGAQVLGRFLSLHQCYMQTLGVAGHIAEVGMYRGAASLFLAKLTVLYEPVGLTQVHGFDWFRELTDEERAGVPDGHVYTESHDRVEKLIWLQGLQGTVFAHKLNVVDELEGFFERHSHLQFKLVFLDAGDYDIVSRAIREFWPRLTPGGIMIFDQFNTEFAPGETRAVRDLLPADAQIRTFPNGWMPTAYVVK